MLQMLKPAYPGALALQQEKPRNEETEPQNRESLLAATRESPCVATKTQPAKINQQNFKKKYNSQHIIGIYSLNKYSLHTHLGSHTPPPNTWVKLEQT